MSNTQTTPTKTSNYAKRKAKEAKALEKPPINDIVKPVITVEGQENQFKAGFDENTELTAVGYMRLNTGAAASWVSYTITTKGNQIVKIEVDEPNVRAIAEETAKIAFVSNFIDQE